MTFRAVAAQVFTAVPEPEPEPEPELEWEAGEAVAGGADGAELGAEEAGEGEEEADAEALGVGEEPPVPEAESLDWQAVTASVAESAATASAALRTVLT
ncbi:hypothetical protein [Streptomyces sp. MBT33]|uniref:hypothetical protein n=1 Tax=Streptomyces sp. MBT33 TaxID=1488363 RepID=UPI0027DB3F34|nr:hypothetical protein [Streptomyces sp. MBT33]